MTLDHVNYRPAFDMSGRSGGCGSTYVLRKVSAGGRIYFVSPGHVTLIDTIEGPVVFVPSCSLFAGDAWIFKSYRSAARVARLFNSTPVSDARWTVVPKALADF